MSIVGPVDKLRKIDRLYGIIIIQTIGGHFYEGRQDNQIQMVILDMDSMFPENHLLRRIKNCVNFDFIYEKAAPYYSNVGRKSIDPVILIKMLLIGYLYGIKSERRIDEEKGSGSFHI